MKSLLTIFALVVAGSLAYADIQAPPMSKQGPTRKLGRGISNVLFFYTELPNTLKEVNYSEGNSAAWGYGFVKGVSRSFYRFGMGMYDIFTFPCPTYKKSFRPPYNANTPWKLNTYSEFPPEIGWESRMNYSTEMPK